MLRNIPDKMCKSAVASVDARLAAVQAEHAVAIPLAIESGSRAWGFPSPDSDYDCRFIFVRSEDDYLRLYPLRDVIETPLDGDMDVNGWDLAKALKLLLKGNAVIVEWLTSPIIYTADEWFRREFADLAARRADRTLVAKHYLHLGERQRHAYFGNGTPFRFKKLFYAMRPAAALRWLRFHPHQAVAPMHFPTLMAECEAPREVARIVEDLIARKAATRELGEGELPSVVAAFIENEFADARTFFGQSPSSVSPEAVEEAQAFFRLSIRQIGPRQAPRPV